LIFSPMSSLFYTFLLHVFPQLSPSFCSQINLTYATYLNILIYSGIFYIFYNLWSHSNIQSYVLYIYTNNALENLYGYSLIILYWSVWCA
jgi:hypothetical protein